MDSTDEEFNGSTSFTTKGRRTKRQRTTTTSIYAGGSAYLENSYGSSASATPSDYQDVVSEVSTEEQDLANCLILLAHGVQKKRSSKNNITTNNNININGVYDCKTCNRTFPSFQALGGHRTSHKKTIKPITISTPPKPKEQPPKAGSQNSSPVPPPHAHATTKPVRIYRNTDKTSGATARVHECSICGSEFPSGQALGGHMRRHRPATTHLDSPINTIDITSTTKIDLGGVNNNNNILSLDLNLPAPSDDHDNEVVLLDDDDHDDDDDDDECSHMVETKFHVIPSPALLMDCHY